MKTAFLKFSLSVAVAMISVSLFAQAPRQGGEGQQRMTPESYAKQKTEALTAALSLDAKQTKEVNKIYLASGRKLFPTTTASSGASDAAPRGGGGGGGRGGGGGGDGESLSGGPSNNLNFGPSQRRVVAGESDKDIASRDKKMKKLLREEQYATWTPMEAEFNQQAKEMLQAPPRGQGEGRPQGGQRPQ